MYLWTQFRKRWKYGVNPPSQPLLPPEGPKNLQYDKHWYACEYISEGDEYGLDTPSQPPLPPHWPTSLDHHKYLCICEHNSEQDGHWNGVDTPLNHEYPLRANKPVPS